MKAVFLLQLFFLVIGTGVLKLSASTQGAISYAAGAGLVLLNLGLLTWAWSKILSKKLVALAVSTIVFKYAIFAVIIYQILIYPGTDKLWFGVGLSTLMITVLSYACLKAAKKVS